MKISIIGPVYPYRGGIAHYNNVLCRKLADAGNEVQIVSFKRQYPAWLYPGESDKEPGGQYNLPSALYVLDPLYVWTWWKTLKLIFSFQPRLVLIQWWTTFWAPAFFFISLFLKWRSIPCVFTIHNVIPHENRWIDHWIARKVLSNGKGFITLSPGESNRLSYLIPSAHIYQSRLPIPEVASVNKERDTLRKEMNIPVDQQVLLFLGIVRPYKGVNVLLDALGILKEKGLSPYLIVAGEFWEDIGLYRKKISDLGLTDQVILENRYIPNEELARFYTVADVFVAPHIQGTQSGAIKMAMSFGLPVLASDHISGDLPIASYPIYVHHAGSAQEIAISIQKFLQKPHDSRSHVISQDNLPEIGSVIEQIETDLC